MSSILVLVTSLLSAFGLLIVARILWKQSLDLDSWLDDEVVGPAESAGPPLIQGAGSPPSSSGLSGLEGLGGPGPQGLAAPPLLAAMVEQSAATVRIHPDSNESTRFFVRAELPANDDEKTEILEGASVAADTPAAASSTAAASIDDEAEAQTQRTRRIAAHAASHAAGHAAPPPP